MASPTSQEAVFCKVCGTRLEDIPEYDPHLFNGICEECMAGRSKILVRMRDGTSRRYPQNKTFRGRYRLMFDDGQMYHTHVNCYLRWNGVSQQRFTGWRLVPTDELDGIRKCSLCSSADSCRETGYQGSPLYDWDHYETREPLGKMSFRMSNADLRIGYMLVPGFAKNGTAEFFTGYTHIALPEETELIGFDDPYTLHFVTSVEGQNVTVSVYKVLFRKNGALIEAE